MNVVKYWHVLFLAGCLAQSVSAQDSGISVVPLESWSNVFGKKKTSFRFAVRSRVEMTGDFEIVAFDTGCNCVVVPQVITFDLPLELIILHAVVMTKKV